MQNHFCTILPDKTAYIEKAVLYYHQNFKQKITMPTIREQLLKIPVHGELAVEEHIRQKDKEPDDLSIANLDDECHASVSMVLHSYSFYWNESLRGYDFWKRIYNKLNE